VLLRPSYFLELKNTQHAKMAYLRASYPCHHNKVTTNWVAKNSRNLLSHSSAGQKFKIEGLAGLVPSGGSERESVPFPSSTFQCLLSFFGVP
jgi:hypothetical protein